MAYTKTKRYLILAAGVLGIGVILILLYFLVYRDGFASGFERGKNNAPPPEIWCLGVIVDASSNLAKVQNNLDKLKGFVEKREGNTNTENEQVFYTLKIKGKPSLKTFYVIGGQTEKSIRDYFMTEGSQYLNLNGGLEFGGDETIDYMTQRLKQLMDEQTSCDKIYIYNLGDDVPDNIADGFLSR